MEDNKRSLSRERILDFCNKYAVVLHLIASFILYFVIECMARHSLSETLEFMDNSTKVFIYNTLLIFLTTLPVFLSKKRAFWRVFVFTIWLLLGAANGFILANRVTPLTGPDFKMIKDGLGVITKYMSHAMGILLIAILIVLAIALIVFYFRSPRFKGDRRFKVIIPCIAAAIIGFYGLTQYC